MKRCTGCQVEKSIEDFYRKAASKDGRASRCKVCANASVKRWERANPEKIKERTYRWRKKYPEKHQVNARRSQLKIKWGITVDQYERRLVEQGGCCAICRTADPGTRWGTFQVDHDHSCCPGTRTCGKCLRGLLCGNCNSMLGMAADRPEVLQAGIDYLKGDRWFPIEAGNTDSSISQGSGSTGHSDARG